MLHIAEEMEAQRGEVTWQRHPAGMDCAGPITSLSLTWENKMYIYLKIGLFDAVMKGQQSVPSLGQSRRTLTSPISLSPARYRSVGFDLDWAGAELRHVWLPYVSDTVLRPSFALTCWPLYCVGLDDCP